MEDLSGSAYVKALQSEDVTLLVGAKRISFNVAKDLLCLKSPVLAELLSTSSGSLELPGENVKAIETFICWCYQGHLKPPSSTDLNERNQHKSTLILLWLFAARYQITQLQNNAMSALIHLFNTPHLLSKNNVEQIWARTEGLSAELRSLAAFVVVAQIEEDDKDCKTNIEDLNDFAHLEGFLGEIYSALKSWLEFSLLSKTPKKGKGKLTKWVKFMEQKGIRDMLNVNEVEAKSLETRPTKVKTQPGTKINTTECANKQSEVIVIDD